MSKLNRREKIALEKAVEKLGKETLSKIIKGVFIVVNDFNGDISITKTRSGIDTTTHVILDKKKIKNNL